MPWNYERTEQKFEVLPEGAYRIRIRNVDKAVSSNGNDMLVFQFEVSGSTKILYHYIVFMPDRPEITNRKLTQFFDSFKSIDEGNFDTTTWIGKVGAAQIKHETYNGETREKIHYFISASKQDSLPAWKEADGSTSETYETVPEEDIPF